MKRITLELSSAASGQLASALPVLLVSIFLARTTGLTAVGYFTAATGVSAVIYQVALFGLRNLIVVDQLRNHTFANYVSLRCILLIISFPFIIFVGPLLGIPILYLIVVAAIKLGDAFIDLNLAYDQVTKEMSHALRSYSRIAWIKLLILSLSMLAWWLFLYTGSVYPPELFVIIGCLLFVILVSLATRSRIREFSEHNIGDNKPRYMKILRQTAWFGVASLVCVTITALPRFLLPSITEGNYFGVAGASLSASTFFGMIFYATWLRSASKFSREGLSYATVGRFIAENVVILVLLALGAFTAFPVLLGYVFGFSDPGLLAFSGAVMAAGSLFFATMNCANMFKVSSTPWLEPLTYGVPAAAALLMHLSGIHFTLLVLLVFLAAGMAVCFALGMIWARRDFKKWAALPEK